MQRFVVVDRLSDSIDLLFSVLLQKTRTVLVSAVAFCSDAWRKFTLVCADLLVEPLEPPTLPRLKLYDAFLHYCFPNCVPEHVEQFSVISTKKRAQADLKFSRAVWKE